MLDYFQGAVIILIEMYCFTVFMDSLYESICENKGLLMLIRLIVLTIGTLIISLIFDKIVILKVIFIIVVNSIIHRYFNKQPYIKNIFGSIIFMGMVLLVDYIALSLYSVIVPNNLIYVEVIQPLIVLLSKSILFLVVLLLKRVVDRKDISLLRDSDWIRFLFFPVFTVIATTLMLYNSEKVVKNNLGFILWIIACGLVGIEIFVFYFIISVTKKQRIINEKELLNVQAQNQLSYYERIKEDFEKQRYLSHEYSNRIECISGLLNENNIDDLKKYVDDILHRNSGMESYIDANNAIVNAIINAKYREALEKNIVFIFFINDLSKLSIPSEDIVVLLANSLNNAIEACSNCDRKIIKLKVYLEENVFFMSVRNTFDGIIKKRQNEILTTKKYDEKFHGYGIKNIERVVKKNNGDISIVYDEKEFYISIMIQQKS